MSSAAVPLPARPPKFYDAKTGAQTYTPQTPQDYEQLNKFYNQISGNVQYLSNAQQTVVNGATSGTATFSMNFTGNNYKKVVIHCAALTGAASFTFPIPFAQTPDIQGALSGIAAVTLTGVTVTGSTSTGFIFLEGY